MEFGSDYLIFIVRWLHVLSGVMWVGLLWYFNFVQTPSMAKIADEHKPAVTKHIAPEALFWFRWSALSTVIFGVLVAWMEGYLGAGLLLGMTEGANAVPSGVAGAATIGFGMWFGLIMAFNVWFIIWPNQKKILGIVEATDEEKGKAKRIAFLASRSNTLMSIPVLLFMQAGGHGMPF